MLTDIMLEEAQDLIINNVVALPGEAVGLETVLSRICHQDIHALHDLPPVYQSAVDGYAVALDNGAVANKYMLKECLRPGGHPCSPLNPGEAASVVTGGPVPPGAQAVIATELTKLAGGHVTCWGQVRPGDNLKKPGEDFPAGALIAKRGTIITPGLIGALSAYGISKVKVFNKPRVAVLSLGRDIVPYHQVPAPGQTRDSNSMLLSALVKQDGAEATGMQTVGEMEAVQIKYQLEKLLESADVVLTTGGAASGSNDQALVAIRMTGARPLFWGVKVKPGSHSGAAVLNSKLIISLSGNPAACATGYYLLAAPALRALQGLNPAPVRLKAVCKNSLLKKGGPRRFVRGHAFWHAGNWHVSFLPEQKSSMLRPLINCNALIDLPAGHPPIVEGQEVSVLLVSSYHTWGALSVP